MRIILVDDHTLVREATAEVLVNRLGEEVNVIGAASAQAAFSMLSHYREVDLLILDLGLPELNGIDAIPQFQSISATTPILVLSADENRATVHDALMKGVSGYISKNTTSAELVSAVRVVLSGEIYVPPHYLEDMPPPMTEPDCVDVEEETVTPRQLDVLKLMAQGRSNKAIASQLDIKEATVKLHVSAVLRLLGAQNRTEAVNVAVCRNLIQRG